MWKIKRRSEKITHTEELELNDAIWDKDMDIPSAHQNIVYERILEYKANPDILLDCVIFPKNSYRNKCSF